jgi:hypothetical protein
LLDLPAVLQLLLEDAELVAQPVAHGRDLQRGERVHQAGGEATEAPVAQPRIGLLVEDLLQRQAVGGQALPRVLEHLEREQVGLEPAPRQVLGGQVVYPLHVELSVAALGADPAVHDAIAGGVDHGLEQVARGGRDQVLGEGEPQVIGHRAAQCGRAHARAVVLDDDFHGGLLAGPRNYLPVSG